MDPASAAVQTAFGESGYAAAGGSGDADGSPYGISVNDDDPGEGSEEYYGTQDMWANGNGYGGSGSGYKSFARAPDVGRPNTTSTPNTPSTPGSAGRAALVPRTAEADRKDWQTSFTDRRT